MATDLAGKSVVLFDKHPVDRMFFRLEKAVNLHPEDQALAIRAVLNPDLLDLQYRLKEMQYEDEDEEKVQENVFAVLIDPEKLIGVREGSHDVGVINLEFNQHLYEHEHLKTPKKKQAAYIDLCLMVEGIWKPGFHLQRTYRDPIPFNKSKPLPFVTPPAHLSKSFKWPSYCIKVSAMRSEDDLIAMDFNIQKKIQDYKNEGERRKKQEKETAKAAKLAAEQLPLFSVDSELKAPSTRSSRSRSKESDGRKAEKKNSSSLKRTSRSGFQRRTSHSPLSKKKEDAKKRSRSPSTRSTSHSTLSKEEGSRSIRKKKREEKKKSCSPTVRRFSRSASSKPEKDKNTSLPKKKHRSPSTKRTSPSPSPHRPTLPSASPSRRTSSSSAVQNKKVREASNEKKVPEASNENKVPEASDGEEKEVPGIMADLAKLNVSCVPWATTSSDEGFMRMPDLLNQQETYNEPTAACFTKVNFIFQDLDEFKKNTDRMKQNLNTEKELQLKYEKSLKEVQAEVSNLNDAFENTRDMFEKELKERDLLLERCKDVLLRVQKEQEVSRAMIEVLRKEKEEKKSDSKEGTKRPASDMLQSSAKRSKVEKDYEEPSPRPRSASGGIPEEKTTEEELAAEEKAAEEKTEEEKAAEEKAAEEKTAEEKTVEEKTVEEKAVEEKDASEEDFKEVQINLVKDHDAGLHVPLGSTEEMEIAMNDKSQ